MNKLAVLGLSLVLVGAGCASQVAEQPAEEETQNAVVFVDGDYALGGESAILWEGSQKLGTGKHDGTLTASASSLVVENGEVSEGKVTVDMSTLTSTDGSGAKLEGHLKSADFFDVENHPESSFAFSSLEAVEGLEEATHRVDGVLTIKGVANEVSFPAMIETSEGTIHVSGALEIDRTEWDIRYGSDKFFDNLGDAVISDMMTINLDLYFVSGADAMMEGEDKMEEKEGEAMEEKEDDDHDHEDGDDHDHDDDEDDKMEAKEDDSDDAEEGSEE